MLRECCEVPNFLLITISLIILHIFSIILPAGGSYIDRLYRL